MTREEMYAELKERHAQVNWNDLQSIKEYNGLRSKEGIMYNNRMASEAQRRATKKYNATHIQKLKFNLNIKTDADILQKLESVSNKQGYIKALIRQDISGNIPWNKEV